MSLNGLDDAKVKEAHQAAVAEPGGWFLLKYASRDEIELLGRGNGGIVEIRNNIAQYEDPSPLYGFLRYRRRNVMIKYLPEECSRLVQARTAVHFNSICDYFAPCDTTFSIAAAKELKDTKLSAACSLHTASGSTSSSTSSLRRRRLMEIAEEEEEEERERKRQSLVDEEDERPRTPGGTSISGEPVTLDAELAKSPDASNFAGGKLETPEFVGVRPSSPAKSFDESARRSSSQSARADLYSYSSYPYSKPRVKLGPRPSLETRPKTSAGAAAYRPKSSIPAGFKASLKASKKVKPEGKTDDVPESPAQEKPEITFLAASIPIPENSPLEVVPQRPHTSSGAHGVMTSTVSIKANLNSMSPPSIKNTMTPEKARLMKAMKLREKKKKMEQHPGAEAPIAETIAETTEEQEQEPQPQPNDEVTHSVKVNQEQSAQVEEQLDNRLSISKADSGIDIEVGNDAASIDTRTDSHPTSPIAASSDIGDSTKASSLSESTDETVLPSESKPFAPEIEEDLEVGETENSEEEQPKEQYGGLREEQKPEEALSEPNRDLDNEPQLEPAPANGEPTEAEDAKVVEVAKTDEKAVEATHIEQDDIKTADQEEIAPPHKTLLPISNFSASSPTTSQIPDNQHEQPTENAHASDPATSADVPETTQDTAEEEETPQVSTLKIPTSKFSTKEGKSPPTSPIVPAIPSIVASAPEPDQEVIDARSAPAPPPKDDQYIQVRQVKQVETLEIPETGTLHLKRRTAIEPIRTDIAKRLSVVSLVDDDALMEELQSATFEEAKPVSVSKSPLLPPSGQDLKRASTMGTDTVETPRLSRTTSNPLRGPLPAQGDVTTSTARAVSSGAAYLHKITQQQNSAELRPKSAKLGSSISQRIKALEKLSSHPGAPETPPSKERPQSTFFSVRNVSKEASSSPSLLDRTSSLNRGATPSPGESRESSPETERHLLRSRGNSISNRMSMFERGRVPRGKPESIQVTARIVRDPGQPFPKGAELKTDTPLELQQSMLLVDHQRAASPEETDLAPAAAVLPAQTEESVVQIERKPSLLQRRFSSKSRRSQHEDQVPEEEKKDDTDTDTEGNRPRRRSSLTVVKDFIKDRRDSLRGILSPSSDNLTLNINSASTTLGSPTIGTPSRSPSRPPSVHQNNNNLSLTQRLSFSSRRSSIDAKSPGGFSTNGRAPFFMAEGDADSDGESRAGEVKPGSASSSNAASTTTSPNLSGSKGSSGNRTSRFMRRLSNSLGTGRKNSQPAISPTVAEEDAAEVEAALAAAPNQRYQNSLHPTAAAAVVAYMGDVNVQFPDNLLWKRRTMCLDSTGFLILSASPQGATSMTSTSGLSTKDARTHAQGNVRRYHMSEFRAPYIPEMEVQELPNSVVLDFVEGSGLQVACEDRAGQLNVLHVLKESHQNHTNFGQ